jgi:hypothetical protein
MSDEDIASRSHALATSEIENLATEAQKLVRLPLQVWVIPAP